LERQTFVSRIARPSDYDKIVRLCRRSVGPDDYVIRILKQTIREKGLFLVFSKKDGDLIGISNFTPVFDKSGWVGMWRTDPAWRGRGAARFVQQKIAKYARRKGLTALRCFILSTNSSSIRAAVKSGFKLVAHATHITSTSKSWKMACQVTLEKELEKGSKQTSDREIFQSSYTRKMGGYLRYGYAFVLANHQNLRYINRQNELYCSGRSCFIMKRTEKDYGEFCILFGRLKQTLFKILGLAKMVGMKTIGGFVPFDNRIIRTCRSLGFRVDSWAKHVLVFEKKI
jgi:RimJ/RimL family protein N-acetyltransferase